MSVKLKEIINSLPNKIGVYFFLGEKRKIIYIGKAADIKERVQSHFSNILDTKSRQKIENTKTIEFVECNSEIEALFLEAEFIKRYQPKYNVEWKDEKNFLYVKVTKGPIPDIELARRPLLEPKTEFFGPYTDSTSLRRALRVLTRIFPVRLSEKGALKQSFLWHEKIVKDLFPQKSLYRKIRMFFKGKVAYLIKDFEKEMRKAASKKHFEKAALFRDRIKALYHIKETAIFREEEALRIRSDSALLELKERLNLKNIPRLIEAFDISNIFGKEATGSAVVFKDGIPQKNFYKKFKIKTVKGIDDYKMLREVLGRRFKGFINLPDLVLIDGGKGHLSTALGVFRVLNLNIDVAAIAKKEEDIFIYDNLNGKIKKVRLKMDSPALLLLRRIRDESHRFAITYHKVLRTQKIRSSKLDDILGIGKKTKKRLLEKFKSIGNIKKAPQSKLEALVGEKLAEKIKKEL